MALPSWIKPANTLGAIEAGASAGSRTTLNPTAAISAGAEAGSARARLEQGAIEAAANRALEAQQQANQLAMARERNAQEMVRARMEMDARQKTQEQQTLKENQRIKVEDAYREQQLGLQQDRLNQAEAQAAARAKAAAVHFAAQQGYASARAAGKSNEQALWENPGLLTPGTISSSNRPIPTMSESRQFAASPVMQKEEQDTEDQIRSGIPELKAIQDHPTLLDNPPFAQRWGPRYNSALRRDHSQQDKANKPPKETNVSALANQRKSLTAQLEDKDLPDATKAAYKAKIRKIDTDLNGGVPPPPTDEDIAHLKDDPKIKDKFEQIYGSGSADQYLTPATDEAVQAQ